MSEISLYKLNQDLINKADKFVVTNTTNGLMSIADKLKLDGIEPFSNNYVLPIASTSTLGGIKIGSGINIDSNAIISVPNVTTSVNGLMLFTDKNKLDGIAANANNYILPKATISSLGGVIVGTGLLVDTAGILTVNTTQVKADIGVVTSGINGLMSAADKIKLDGITSYTLPTASGSTLGGIKVGSGLLISYGVLSVPAVSSAADGLMLAVDKIKLDGIALNANNYVLPIASTSEVGGVKIGTGISVDNTGIISIPNASSGNSGLMSIADKTKLDSISSNANNYTLPIASTTALGGIKIGNGINIDGSGIISIHNATVLAGGLMSADDKSKLDTISYNANNYTLPTASTTILGGIKIGNGLSINSGVVSVPVASPIVDGLMAGADKTKLDDLYSRNTEIVFNLINPGDNAESNRYIVKRNLTISNVTVYCKETPSSAITIELFQNSASIGTITIVEDELTTVNMSKSLAINDVIYIRLTGQANGVTSLTVDFTAR